MPSGKKILLVDDEVIFAEPIEFWLKTKGYDVRVATNGRDAIDMIKKNRPDIVFLDLRMPVMNGIETLQEIRTFDADLPVIIITVEYANKEKLQQVKDSYTYD